MYAKITEEIQQSYYKQNYPNEGQRFVAWYLRNIHGLDAAQTKLAITDGAENSRGALPACSENVVRKRTWRCWPGSSCTV